MIKVVLDAIDVVKDLIYFIILPHNFIPLLVLASSLSAPVSIVDSVANDKNGTFLIHNLLIYVGITLTNKDEEQTR